MGHSRPSSPPISTVGRQRGLTVGRPPDEPVWDNGRVRLCYGDVLDHAGAWPSPTAIVSDGAYGVLGFEGDTSDHVDLPGWYEPHVAAWSRAATARTTLWFWNSEIGWAAVHPVLERHGWRYQNCNVWNKTKAHIAGNVNTKRIRRFPVVSEVCVQYVLEARIDGLVLKAWLLREWKRTGLALRRANEACGVRDAAVRKYLDQGHLWYFMPPEAFERMQAYANVHGDLAGRPYFVIDGEPGTAAAWARMRAPFRCPHGWTNVWERAPVKGEERLKGPDGKALHLNQKPLDLMRMIIEASTDVGDVVWEPFGGLFTACVAATAIGRRACAAEIDASSFAAGVSRINARA